MEKAGWKTAGKTVRIMDNRIREKNIENIVRYFKAGEKKECCKNAGVEIEHFVVGKEGNPADYEEMVRIMEEMKQEEEKPYYEEGHLLGFYNDQYSVTLEPASQVEISIAPKSSIAKIETIYGQFRKRMDELLEKKGLWLVNTGYHPYKKAEELQLIPKKRYEFMNRYFEHSGTLGRNMMRATASVQVSLDYKNETDFVEKYRLACILSPVLSLITDNSPVFEGKRAQNAMVRTNIWMHTDDVRCGIFPGTFLEGFGYRAYAEYLYKNPPILVMDKAGGAVFTGDKTVSEIYEDKEMSTAEIEHVISMFFPDVRLKNYIEMRMADSMELPLALGYTALVKALFYEDRTRRELLNYFGKVEAEDVREAKLSFIRNGYQGEAYQKSAAEIMDKLIEETEESSELENREYAKVLLEKMKTRKRIYE